MWVRRSNIDFEGGFTTENVLVAGKTLLFIIIVIIIITVVCFVDFVVFFLQVIKIM